MLGILVGRGIRVGGEGGWAGGAPRRSLGARHDGGWEFERPAPLVALGGGAPSAVGLPAADTSRLGCPDGAAPERSLSFHLQRGDAPKGAGAASGSARGI